MKRTEKIIIFACVCLAFLMIGAFVALELGGLDAYKAKAKEELENYAIDKGRENYLEDNWIKILECVDEGKTVIDGVLSKWGVDKALSNAKKKIDEIPADISDMIPDDILEVKTEDMIEFNTWFFTSGLKPNAITVKSDITNATFECIVYEGILIDYDKDNENGTGAEDLKNQHPKFKRRILNNNETIYWGNYCFEKDERPGMNIEHDYIDIIVYDGDNIIGYAVIKIVLDKDDNYDPVVLKSALFPKVEGSYQHITEDILKSKFDKIKGLG